MQNALKAGEARLEMQVTIKRAATGKEEQYTLIGTAVGEDKQQQQQEQNNGSDTHNDRP